MKNKLINHINNFINNLLSYKGIDKDTLQFKKTYWIAIAVVTLFVLGMTALVIHLNIKGLIIYGILLLSIYIPLLVLYSLIPNKLVWMVHLSQHLAIFFTYYSVVILGGIANSGGIFLAALNAVIVTILFYNIRWTIWYFVLFILGTIVSFIIQLHYDIQPEMVPRLNNLFFLLNTLFISGLTLVVVLVYMNQFARLEKDRADRLKKLNDFKTNFYTNITHEFRTPLTVILGATEQIENQKAKNPTKPLKQIRQNSNKLLQLVNQMLNLSKLEEGVMPIHFIQGDIIRFINYVSEQYRFTAKKNNVNFKVNSTVTVLMMDYDSEKLAHILSNLLGNAIKFTPQYGDVELNLILNKKQLVITISDSGPGIPSSKINKVFERYYQIKDTQRSNNNGFGLGLSITKEMVELLKGEIRIKSTEGNGTEVQVILPVNNKAPIESQLDNLTPEKPYELKVLEDISTANETETPTILIVEDNDDVLEYLCTLLKNKYKVYTAKNGIEGIKYAQTTTPDIIISDIMMPKMDGIEMLKTIKTDFKTSHIPVILLTAKADMESKIEGISMGAEAYLTKPFNKKELYARLQSLVQIRKELQQRYSIPGIISTKSNNVEDTFMTSIHSCFNKNMDNEDFGVNEICQEMNMSRSQLYRKFRALTNSSVNNYFRKVRLLKARQLLQTSELNVTQIAFEVGFKNLSHFSKAFYVEFGIYPSQLKNS